MKNTHFLSPILCLLFALSTNLQADIILSVEVDPPVDAGNIATVSFFARSNTGQQITAVNLPIDIGVAGTGMPSELSFFTNPSDSIVNEIGGATGALNVATNILSVNNTDAVANLDFNAVTLTTQDTLLFDLLLNVDPSAGTGSFPVSINDGDALFNGFSFNISDENESEITSGISAVPGSVNIVAAIPEPNSVIVLAALSIGFAVPRRKTSSRRKV